MCESVDIPKLETELLRREQVECPLKHRFCEGVYLREIFMPAGSFVIGHRHKTRHFNIILTGRARVLLDGAVREIQAPYTFISEPGIRKVLYVIEDMVWQTVHPTPETDVKTLEFQLVTPSNEFITHEEERALFG